MEKENINISIDIVQKISNEILSMKGKTKFRFTEIFDKYEIAEEEKFEYFNILSKQLKGWISIDDKFAKAITGLPYNTPYIKNKKFEIKPSPTNVAALEEIIQIIESGNSYSEIPSKEENGITILGGISYNEKVINLFEYMPYHNKEFKENYRSLQSKNIEELNIDQTTEYLTLLYRSEKICEGNIQQHIANGKLVALLKRYLELYK
jgi:hypothetical protein